MKPRDRQRYMKVVNEATIEMYMETTLIQAIKESPLKISILEKWEHIAYHGQTNALRQLGSHHQNYFLNFSSEDARSELLFVRLIVELCLGIPTS